jgi:hypothetical protein
MRVEEPVPLREWRRRLLREGERRKNSLGMHVSGGLHFAAVFAATAAAFSVASPCAKSGCSTVCAYRWRQSYCHGVPPGDTHCVCLSGKMQRGL